MDHCPHVLEDTIRSTRDTEAVERQHSSSSTLAKPIPQSTTDPSTPLAAARDATNQRHQITQRSRSPPLCRSSRLSRNSLAANDQARFFTEQQATADIVIPEQIAGNQQHRNSGADAVDHDLAAVEGRLRGLSIQPDHTSLEEPLEFFSLQDLLEYESRNQTRSRYVRVPVYNPFTDRWTTRETYVLDGFGNDPEHDPALQEMLNTLGWTKGPEEARSVKRD